MRVQDIMSGDVQCCGPDTNLVAAAKMKMMWGSDCGALPVLNVQGQVMSVITDRDICMAAATKHKPASDITVWETVCGKAYTCHISDDVHTVLGIMKREQVRRLPVLDDRGVLPDIVALNDFVLPAGETKGGRTPSISYEDGVRTFKTISAHRVLVGN